LSVSTEEEAAGRARSGRPAHLRWWKEALTIAAFYGVYSFIRNQFGSEAVSPEHAFDNAKRIITLERWLGSYHEETIQDWFLDDRWFIQFWNLFYGSFHFVVTAFGIVFLYRWQGHRYVRWRTTLAFTTGLALIGFATFPLMPPRLLPASYGFVDTLRTYGGLWSFDDSALKAVSNQYAAMPSLHIGWAIWSTCVFLPAVRRPWLRALVISYPLLTTFAIVVTGNHYWIDALGGAVIVGIGYLLGSWWDRKGWP
jgi:PAP2 superfamily